jgi:arylsulfatase A-like enzyme
MRRVKAVANQAISRCCHRLPLMGAAYDELYFQYCHKAGKAASDSFDNLRPFPSADVIVDAALAWLNEISGRRFFLWLHLMDPHAPYYPKAEALQAMRSEIGTAEAHYLNAFWMRKDIGPLRLQKKTEAIQELYDAGIRWADEQIARLTRHLDELQLWKGCTLAVTADHGEEFLDHGQRFHPPLHLYNELIRVPLIVRLPGYQSRHDIREPFGLIDLAPTLLDALGLPAPVDFRGTSCLRKIASAQPIEKTVFTECVLGCTNPLEQRQRKAPRLLAVRAGDYKLVIHLAEGEEQLFDLRSDPEELHPLPLTIAAEMRRFLLEYARQHIAESRRSRNRNLRLAAQMRDFRISAGGLPN